MNWHISFSEIFDELLMYVWKCGKSYALEAFAWFTVTRSPLIELTNEYCAHTVDGRFIPGYQSYGSFTSILKQNFNPEKDKEQINFVLFLGNTLAHDIIYILEGFITQIGVNKSKSSLKMIHFLHDIIRLAMKSPVRCLMI